MSNEDKLQNLNFEDLDKVSSGYSEKNYSTNTTKVYCDNCGCSGGVPINSGHLCFDCIQKLKDEVGNDVLMSIVKGDIS